MTLKELISKLQEHQEQFGDAECVINVDTPDCFNFINNANLLDVSFDKFKATDTNDGYVYYVNFHSEVYNDDED
jgi:hypothetical protein